MYKNSKLLISASIAAIFFLILQIFYVFVLPKCINISGKIPEIERIMKEQTNSYIKIKNPSFKTFFDFSFEIKADSLNLENSDKKQIFYGNDICIKIQPLSLLLKQISVKNLEVSNLLVNLTRYNEKVFGFGDKIKFDFDSNFELKLNNTNVYIEKYNISLDDKYIGEQISFNGNNIDVIPINRNFSEVLINGNISSKEKIAEYKIDFENI